VIFAAVSVWLALRARTEAERALVYERRLDFELNIISQISDYLSRPMAWREWYPYVRTLLTLLPGEDMPKIRSYYLDGPSDEGRWHELGLDQEAVWLREIEDATRGRLDQVTRRRSSSLS
jgi:hypothetical protein